MNEAKRIAERLIPCLLEAGFRAEVCGPFRRKCERVPSLPILFRGPLPLALQTIKRRFGVLGIDVEIINQKENFCGLFVGGVPVNLYLATREYWGAMLLYLTGPEGFNRKISSEAKKQGYRLGRYGLFFGKDRVAGKTEEQIFDALGLEYVLPEDRSSGKGKKPLEEKEEK